MTKRKKNRQTRRVAIEESVRTIDHEGETFDIAAHVRLALSTALTALEKSPLYPTTSDPLVQEARDAEVPLVSEFEN